jgi:predicted TIM-barrel fold metal-dependent hydrolase
MTAVRREVEVIDTDVHLGPRSLEELIEHMPEPWRSRIAATPRRLASRQGYFPYWPANRMDSSGRDGAPAGSDPAIVTRQLFRDAGVDFGIVVPFVSQTVDPELNLAISQATNRWQAATWLGDFPVEDRLWGSILVPLDDPGAACVEIERWAGHPRFRQVLINHHSDRPLGYPQYEPIWAAAARHGLPVAMHFSGHAGEALGASPVGPFQSYVDYHSMAYPSFYAAHLLSWICSGVFDRLPTLRFVLLEGGFLWHRPIVARLARHWDATRAELSARRDPLDYVLEHVRFSSQPIEECDEPGDLALLFERADAARTLLFSSDYPHYDFDAPARTLPRGLDADTRRRIMCDNAIELYRLPAERPMDAFDRAAGDT